MASITNHVVSDVDDSNHQDYEDYGNNIVYC